MSPVLVVSALLMGLLGSTHCVVMCGGVVAMTCSALPLSRRGGLRAQLPYLLAFNAGRIASYAAAGAMAGVLGASVASFGAVTQA
ncbi:MAG: sulfite exporter TauE/SafE family protein, partial [Polyangiaceae bacterium]